MQLRTYQQEAIDSIYWFFQRSAEGNPVLELPTGSGKSFVQAELAKRLIQANDGFRVLCLAHVKELIKQNYAELITIWPTAPAGIYSAGLNQRDTNSQIIFASIQSVYRRAAELGHFDLIIIDEAHLVPVKASSGTYRAFLDRMTEINPRVKIIGMSATPYRMDNGLLVEGDNRIFTDLISAKKMGADLANLVDLGHLAPLVTPDDPLPTFSINNVGVRGGEFMPGELKQQIEEQSSVTKIAVDEIIHRGRDRNKWIIFGTSIDHCQFIKDLLMSEGSIFANVISADTPKEERRQTIEDFQAGLIRAVISVNVLSTGFNVKDVDLIAMMRPTKSASLYVQQAGRGMRTFLGKENCLVLDFAGNIERFGSVDAISTDDIKKKGDSGGTAPVKECPECQMRFHAAARVCEFCDYEFPIIEVEKINDKSSTAEIMGAAEVTIVHPDSMRFYKHKKQGKPDSMKVEYYAGINRVATEYVCLFHGGYAQTKAQQWIDSHIDNEYEYNCINDLTAISAKYARVPDEIHLKKNGKYTNIVNKK